jgi:hypothetical protein
MVCKEREIREREELMRREERENDEKGGRKG